MLPVDIKTNSRSRNKNVSEFKVDLYDLVILTTFGHLTGEETGMNFDRILVIVARYVHTVSLNIIIMTIRCSTQKMLILSK